MATLNSIKKLADAIGRADVVVGRWLRDPRWPFARRGPWKVADVSEMRTWAAENLQENRASGETGSDPRQSAKSKAQTILAIRRARHLEVTTGILEQRFHNAEECRNRRVRFVVACREDLLEVPDAMSGDRAAKEEVKLLIRQRLERFAAGYVADLTHKRMAELNEIFERWQYEDSKAKAKPAK